MTIKLQGQYDDEIINSMIQQAGGAAAFAVGGKLNSALARLRGKESLEPREAARVLFEESKTRMENIGKEQFSKLQTLAADANAKITIENGKLQIEVIKPDTPSNGVTGPSRGGRAEPFDLFEWERRGYKYEDLEKVRTDLMVRQDAGRVTEALNQYGLKVDCEMVEAVKKYNFDSAGIGLSTQNYDAWNRLATGKGQMRDVQYLKHEIREVEELRRIQQETGFDFMGKNYEQLSAADRKKWRKDWNETYIAAHQKALETEYDFVTAEVERATNGQVRISRTQAAVADAESANYIEGARIGRTEGVDRMKIDGMDIKKHSNYANWQQKANEAVPVRSSLRRELGLSMNRDITLAELVLALRRSAIKTQ